MQWTRTKQARIALARNLKKHRKLADISIDKLARCSGLSELDLMRTELGQNCISNDDLYLITTPLNIKSGDLFK